MFAALNGLRARFCNDGTWNNYEIHVIPPGNYWYCAHIPLCSVEIRMGQENVTVSSRDQLSRPFPPEKHLRQPWSHKFRPAESRLWVDVAHPAGARIPIHRYPTSGGRTSTSKRSTIVHNDPKKIRCKSQNQRMRVRYFPTIHTTLSVTGTDSKVPCV